ncbi:MAG: protein kinase [Terracidiphilus sp.]|jgi:serine/threonine-protein kinase
MKSCPVCSTDYPDQHTTCPVDGAVLIESHELTAGSLVRGKYRIANKLGQGGMGVVYLADDILLGVRVALKFLANNLCKDPKFIKRFRMEARAAYQLRHPNIVEVTNLDQGEDGSLFIAMEYVDGPSLRTALESARGGMAVPRALEITRGIAAGLAAAHAQGTVHRDIKPENILLARTSDGRERPKVLDFGIVAMAESVTRASLTQGLLLTPDYAAPEQWMETPAAEIDGRTDLYALGCVFYEMLTGRTPFRANSTSGWMKQHLEETPLPPSQLRQELVQWQGLDQLVMRMLAKNRYDRPQDAELLSLLDGVQYGPGQVRTATIMNDRWEQRPGTVVEDKWARQQSHTVVQQKQPAYSEPALAAAPARVAALLPKPVAQRLPGWAWGVLGVLALGAVFASGWYFARPKTQTVAQQAPVQPAANTAAQNYPYNATPESNQPAMPMSGAASRPIVQQARVSPGRPGGQAGSLPGVQPAAQQNPGAAPAASITSPAQVEEQALALYNAKRYSEAAPLLTQACGGGSWKACNDLGNLYRDGNGVQKDSTQAARLYGSACQAGNASACNNLGVLYQNGNGVEKDDSKATALFARACDAGDSNGCSNEGITKRVGIGVEKDTGKAKSIIKNVGGKARSIFSSKSSEPEAGTN